jgi:hypothetical protein
MDVDESVDGLAREIVGTAGRLSAALGRWLLLIARLDATAGCFELGFASTAAWLAYSCGLSNLILLCQPDHLGLHNGEYVIAADGRGGFRFVRPDGVDIPEHVNPADHIHTDIWLEDEHPDIDTNSARTRWDGQRLDRDYAISVIADTRAHYRDRQPA